LVILAINDVCRLVAMLTNNFFFLAFWLYQVHEVRCEVSRYPKNVIAVLVLASCLELMPSCAPEKL
jgi:hypothetical protein